MLSIQHNKIFGHVCINNHILYKNLKDYQIPSKREVLNNKAVESGNTKNFRPRKAIDALSLSFEGTKANCLKLK